MASIDTPPVFLDPLGRRARGWRRFWLVAGGIVTIFAALLVVGVAMPPLIPSLPINHQLAPPIALTRDQRERIAIRRRLAVDFRHPAPPARHGRLVPAGGGQLPARRGSGTDPIVAGFFVTWQDNSLASVNQHLDALDWIICEWSFLAPGGDSVQFRITRRLFDLVRKPSDQPPPAILIMVSNFDTRTKDFSVSALRAFLTSPAAQARAIAQFRNVVVRDSLAGVTVDFEDVPEDLQRPMVRFDSTLRATLAPLQRIVTAAVPSYATPTELRHIGAATDYVLAMLFDEHYGRGEPGPIASQSFYLQHALAVTAAVPPDKVILMMGAYGYEWHDDGTPGEQMTFQETMQAAHAHHVATQFDTASLTPYVTWTDPDSVDHIIWYLDGATAYNELQVAKQLGVAGSALWRLGQEDGAVWQILDRHGLIGGPDSLRTVPPGYDVEFINDVVCGTSRRPALVVHGERVCPLPGEQPDTGGDILRIRDAPAPGRRTVSVDPASGLIVRDSIQRFPIAYVVDRYGQSTHKVALTFDDGPDGRWTPMILDTLKAYHVPATFFVIGENADTHFLLLRRIYAEGHEIGNHTYFHPNLALVSDQRVSFELDATESLIESILNHRTAFFRPSYFGDAAPTTPDELDPIRIATRKGYYTVGLRNDAEDWQPIPTDSILHLVLGARDSGNVVLLHDGGGDRARTVAVLGPLIDSLRANDDTLVLLSDLVGITRDEAMPPLPGVTEAARLAQLTGWAALGVAEVSLYWIFMAAVILGIGRLAIIAPLAIAQRLLRHQRRGEPTPFAPPVSVIVPAFNEGKVIVRTIRSLLAQTYRGPIEIIVIDDGSVDETSRIVRDAYGEEPIVSLHRKDNGGKASALNLGIGHARHEIVIALDADTLFARDAVAELVQPLADDRVGAVAGNAKVGNRVNLVTRWQAVEYVTSQNLDRRAFSLLDGITVVPGAVGAWRKSLVLAAGGFQADTLAEDQDLTLRIRRAGASIAYADGAIGYTEAPDTLRTLARQRFRWSFGTLQCAWKQRDTLLRPRYGSLGWAALPNVWLFQLLLPAISPLADLAFLYSLISILLTRYEHGATYALASLEHVFTYYAVFLVVDWVGAVVAFLMEPGEDRSLTWLVLIQRFVYRQLMYWVVVRSFKTAFQGHGVGWGKLERKATVRLPAPQRHPSR